MQKKKRCYQWLQSLDNLSSISSSEFAKAVEDPTSQATRTRGEWKKKCRENNKKKPKQ